MADYRDYLDQQKVPRGPWVTFEDRTHIGRPEPAEPEKPANVTPFRKKAGGRG